MGSVSTMPSCHRLLTACAGTVHYSHDERIAGLSDHSLLILELRS
jgi:hypothetical protein